MDQQQPGVADIHPAVAVYIAQGDVALVGHDRGRIEAVQSHQKGIGHVHPSVVVHIPQQAVRGRGGPLRRRGAAQPLDDEVHLAAARRHLEARVHVGRQSGARDDQTIDRARLKQARVPDTPAPRRHRRNSRLAVHQYHAPGPGVVTGAQAVEVDPGCRRPAHRVRAVPARRVVARRLRAVHQGGDALTQQVEDLQPHVGRGWQLVRDDRGGVEGIGVVRPQVEALRQRAGIGGQGPGGEGEAAGCVGGCPGRRSPQIGQVEEEHPGAGGGLSGGQPHPALEDGLGAGLGSQQGRCQETGECAAHGLHSVERTGRTNTLAIQESKGMEGAPLQTMPAWVRRHSVHQALTYLSPP